MQSSNRGGHVRAIFLKILNLYQNKVDSLQVDM